jgi:hypothetical protein
MLVYIQGTKVKEGYRKDMKKIIYITAFTILGALVSFLVHAVIEIPIIYLLVSDFNKWGLGLSWESWFFIHTIFSIALLLLGIIFGFTQGRHWWRIIYLNKQKF